jgi:hypothetical protein
MVSVVNKFMLSVIVLNVVAPFKVVVSLLLPIDERRRVGPTVCVCVCLSFHLLSVCYFDQPFVSETMRCVSNDFIENNDNAGQNVRFYV